MGHNQDDEMVRHEFAPGEEPTVYTAAPNIRDWEMLGAHSQVFLKMIAFVYWAQYPKNSNYPYRICAGDMNRYTDRSHIYRIR